MDPSVPNKPMSHAIFFKFWLKLEQLFRGSNTTLFRNKYDFLYIQLFSIKKKENNMVKRMFEMVFLLLD